MAPSSRLASSSTAFFVIAALLPSAQAECGEGESITLGVGGHTECCTVNPAVSLSYSTYGGSHNDNIKIYVREVGSEYYKTASKCFISYSMFNGISCSGSACSSSSNNDCSADLRFSAPYKRMCVMIDCENSFAQCNIDSFYMSATRASTSAPSSTPTRSPPPPSPPPPSPPPPSPPPQDSTPRSSSPYSSSSTSGNCKCTCCKGNYCSASLVGSYDASSSSSCDDSSCRSKYPDVCPASTASGTVLASYSALSSSSAMTTSTCIAVGAAACALAQLA